MYKIDNLDDLDNLDDDLDTLDDINTKQININNKATLNDTIINNTPVDISTKTISLSQDTDLETIELDKLLSGEIKNINITSITKLNDSTTTSTTNSNPIEYTLESLNNMQLKQLKDIAKIYKVKTSGTKQDLVQSIMNSSNKSTSQ